MTTGKGMLLLEYALARRSAMTYKDMVDDIFGRFK